MFLLKHSSGGVVKLSRMLSICHTSKVESVCDIICKVVITITP